MSLSEIEAEIESLTEKINHYNELYYNKNVSEVSDYEFDKLLRRLNYLETKYPQFKKSNSPTEVVGGKASVKFEKVVHEIKMESLQNAFSFDELAQFDKKVKEKVLNVSYVVEPKVDGLSVSLEYINGKFARGSTRGDGFVGEDVTENLRVLESVPKSLQKKIEFLEVRAEVFMPLKQFEQLNSNSKNSFKNPRNAASGSLRQKNSEIVKKRGLQAVVFNLQQVRGLKISNHFDSINFLKSLGFRTIPESKVFSNIEQCVSQIEAINKNRFNYDFEIDGAVIKINSFIDRSALGSTAKFPRWAIAYKYEPEQKQTKLLEIKINVGRTGVLTPVAVFEPIDIAGTIISRASLHNQSYINSRDIRLGDLILVQKAGEVIPEVVKSIEHCVNSKPYVMPSNCPVCGSGVVKNENEVAIRCVNPNCAATLALNIVHFASKGAMNIEGLGKAVIGALIEKKFIKSFVDLFKLKKTDLLELDGFADRSANNLLTSIEKSKQFPLWRLICGLGIRGVGENVAKLLCRNFKNIFEIEKASLESLSKIEGIGPVVGSSVVNFFSLNRTKELILNFKELGLNLNSETYSNSAGKFNNLIFAISGKLENFSRDEFKAVVESNGGLFSSNVKKNVNFLVVGSNPGSKVEKANKLNLQIIDEVEFLKLLNK